MKHDFIWMLLPVMTIMGSVASLFLKRASGGSGIVGTLKNINLYIGGGLYVAAAALNIIVLRFLDFSVVLPMTSLTYVWTMILSYIIFHERITKKKIAGVIAIFAGATIVAM